MKLYYKKLDFKLPALDMNRIVSNNITEGYGEVFRSYEILDPEYFYFMYSKVINFTIKPDKIDYTNITDYGTLPHKDEMKTSINYYLNPENCVTAFWEVTNSNYEPEPIIQLQPDGEWRQARGVKVFDKTKLKLVDYFRAGSEEAYILSVEEVHSVEKPKTHTTREFLRWSWFDYNIQEILASIKINS